LNMSFWQHKFSLTAEALASGSSRVILDSRGMYRDKEV